MKKVAGAVVGFSAPLIGLLVDFYLLHDSGIFQLPITVLGAIVAGLAYFMYESFRRGAVFSSPTLFTETHKLGRFQEAIRIVDDGVLKWAVIPVGGFQYLKAYLYGKNFNQTKGPLAIMPARLLEAMGSRFHIGRVQLVELEQDALKELYKLHSFRRVFDALDHFPTKLYLGIASKTLHADSEDLKRANVGGFGKLLEENEEHLARAARQLDIKLDDDLSKLERAKLKGEIAKKVSQAFDREKQQAQEVVR